MGIAVGQCQKTEWLKYTVKVEADGDYEISANVAAENGTGSFVLYMDSVRIGDEIKSEGKGKDSYSVVSGGKATLKKGEHELKLEITNDGIDIDYIKFTAASGSSSSDDPPTKLAKPAFESNATETESSFAIVDMQGRKLGVIKAASMAEAVEKSKEKMTQNKTSGGIYFVVSNTKNSRRLMQKVVVYER